MQRKMYEEQGTEIPSSAIKINTTKRLETCAHIIHASFGTKIYFM